MNKYCYRLIFSRTHGALRVVSERARRCSSEPGPHIGSGITSGRRLWVTGWLSGLWMFTGPVMADGIVADSAAPPGQRPEVINTQNGLPQVNITAPSQAGVSHNQYQQFDVGTRGAILNNSAVMTSTRMAGMIEGNPSLNPGAAPARVILNEVNSDNPSQLRGFMEVAGGKAQVIVANPAGIVCNGCGTINAGRMTLATGKPQLNADGSVAGYQIERGVVRIEGGGLNGDARHDTEYVDILARAVEVNAGVWAKAGVTVVAGRNHVSADGKTATALPDDGGARPELAIDMGQMGGMYSGSIRMMGTEAGVGVRNQGGQLRAGNVLTVSSEGQLSWQSDTPDAATQAGGDIRLAATGDIGMHGKVYSAGQLAVQSREGVLTQSGTLAAAGDVHLNAARGIQSRGHLLAGSNAESRLVREARLQLDSQGDIRASGRLLSKKRVSATGRQVDISGAQVAAGRTVLTAGAGGVALRQSAVDSGELVVSTRGNVDAQQARVKAGRWRVDAGSLFSQQAVWSQTGDGESRFTLAGTLDNRDGAIEAQRLLLSASQLINQRGRLVALGGAAQHWQAGGLFDNGGGTVGSNGDLRLDTGRLDNQNGTVKTPAGLTLHADGAVNNAGGRLLAGNGLTLETGSTLNNASGTLSGAGVHLVAQRLDNTQGGLLYSQKQQRLTLSGTLNNRDGKVQSGGALQLDAQTLNNTGGTIDGQQQVALRIIGLFDNRSGTVRSHGDQRVSAAGIYNTRGTVSSRGGITLTSARLDNDGGTLISQGAGVYRIDQLHNQHGKVHSGDALTLEGTQISNQGGQLVSARGLTLRSGGLDNSDQGTISSQAAISLLAGRLNNRDGGLILGTTRSDIVARDIDNTAGRLQSSGQMILAGVTQLDNRQGRILASGSLDINAGRSPADSPLALLNQGGRVESAAQLTAHTRTLDNQGGTLLGLQALTLSAQQDYTRQAGETVSSNGTVTFSLSGAFTSLADWLLPGNLMLTAAGITNPATLAGNTLQLTTRALQNTGRIEADTMTLNVDTLDNAAALMADAMTVHGRVIDNHGQPAVMAATQSLTLQAGERLTNREGALIYSGRRLQLHSDDLIENRASFIDADGDTTVEARRLNNLRDGLVIARDAEKRDYKWHRYNYYWRTYGSAVNPDNSTMAPATRQLTFQDEAAAQTSRYGTLLAIDAAGKRAQVRVRDNKGQMTDLWVSYLALRPNTDGSYAMTFYETRGGNQLAAIPTPYQNGFHWEFDWTQVMAWDPEKHIDIGSAPFITDYNNLRERTATGTVTRDRLLSEGIGARILTGGNMVLRISGALLNDASVITASGDLTQDGGGSVDNRAYSVNERRQEYLVDHMDKDTHHWYPTFSHDETTALATVDGVITGNGTVTISSPRITSTTVSQAQISQPEAALNAMDDDPARAPGEQMTKPGTPPLALTQLQHLGKVATAIANNALFSQHTAAGSPFLVVTDERFTRREHFISSDYMLRRAGYDPAQAHKRLGDGFYEQRLVREQVLKLTGRPSAKGRDAMAQYQQLMNNGIKVAQDFHLVPGVALTPEQCAALQQDIVWLVSETVQTADGPQTVWVPKVYLAQTTLRLTGDGAVISGGSLQLSAGSITNAGNLFADKALTVDAGQFLHQSGDIKAASIDIQAGSLALSTNLQDALRQATLSAGDIRLRGTDITLTGAQLDATGTLSLSAGNDLTITAAKSSHTARLEFISGAMGNRTRGGTEAAGSRMAHVSGEWQQAQGSALNAGGKLTLTAGHDVTLTGSQAKAGGQLGVQAGKDINIRAGTTTHTTHLEADSRTSSVSNDRQEERLTLSSLGGDQGVSLVAGSHLLAEGAQVDSKEGRIGISAQDVTIRDARTRTQDLDSENRHEGQTHSHREEQTEREIGSGSTFSGQQGLTVIGRGGNITVTGSTLSSDQGPIALQAKQNVTLNTATGRESTSSEARSQKKGVLKKSSHHRITRDAITRAQGSLLSGERVSVSAGHDLTVSVSAGHDLTVSGSAIAADQDVSLQAGHNVGIGAATETDTHYLLEEKKKIGLLSSGGIGFTMGKQSDRHNIDEKGTTQSQSVSTVGSSQGSVNITAGSQLHIDGAGLVAGKDLTLTGDSVIINPGFDAHTRKETFEQKQSGLNVALSGSVGSALNTAVSAAQHARQEGDRRLNALQNTQAALSGVQAAQAWARDNALTASADAKNAASLQAGEKAAAQGATNTVGVSASYGSQSSKRETRTDSRQAQGSRLSAGQNLSITATGKNHANGSGDITIAGSQLKAGNDLSLNATRDISLQSAQNTDSTASKNSSTGGNIGVGIGVGAGGYGITVSAGVNAGKGHENGSSLTHTDTTLDAGSHLSLTSGRDTTLKGAQASGEKVTADAGRDLTLQSEQDSDRYDARQQNIRAGGSFTFGSMTGSASLSASKDTLHSSFDSVKEQTGLLAGKGGYDIKVKAHTRLDGAVIASSADKEKNRLDTGTLGWRDIHNQADYTADHRGGSLSSGGPVGKDLLSNMAGGILSGANNSGHAEGTTKAGVSAGTLIVRDTDRQQQDVSRLNRDTDHASDGSISPIFNKEKEQSRLKQAQLIGETGGQVMDIIRTQGAIAGLKAQTDPGALSQAREQLERKAQGRPVSDASVMKQAYDNAMQPYGSGSDLQKAAQAVTGALTALAGNNLAGALASGTSPYLATEIKKLTTNPLTGKADTAANTMAHVVLGAVTAQLNNQSAAAGGLGAGGGELAARYIAGQLYPDKTAEQLSESEKQQVSALSQLAAGLAGGLATGDTAGAVTGAQAGKNAVENNFLGSTSTEKRDKLAEKVLQGDKTLQTAKEFLQLENADARSDALVAKYNKEPGSMSSVDFTELASYLRVYAAEMQAQHGEAVAKELIIGMLTGQNYQQSAPQTKAQQEAQAIMNTWGYHKSNASIGDAPLMFGSSVLGTTIKEGMALNAAIGVGVNTGVQLSGNDPFSYVDVIMAGVTAAVTTGKGIIASTPINMGGAAIGSGIKGENPVNSVAGAAAGTVVGGIGGEIIKGAASKLGKDAISDLTGTVLGGYISEKTGNAAKDYLDEKDDANAKK